MDILRTLVEKQALNPEQAKSIAEQAEREEKKPEDLVLERNLVDERSLFQHKAEALQMPLRAVDAEKVPIKILGLIPQESTKYYRMIPLGKQGDTLEIGMVFPEDLKAKDALKFLARQGNFEYTVFLISPSTFQALLRKARSAKGDVKRALEELTETIERDRGKTGGAEMSRLVEDAPVSKMVAVILRTAVEGGASDIHIEPGKNELRVRFRLLGELYPSLILPRNAQAAVVSRVKILSGMRIDETRIPQDGRFSTTIDGRPVDFRVATLPTPSGEKVAIRVLDPETGLKDFSALGLEGESLDAVREAAKGAYGLIFATGPTGSGKTTTLYAILRELNQPGVNIVSIEDPVEYVIQGVNQSQVQPDIGYDFASGLRQLLRQDPDIIMVGEVRDEETASLVIHAALTGHIVLSTLHTNNAKGVIPRLLDMGVDRYLIPATLSVALAQRLVRRLCDACKEKGEPRKAIQDLLAKELGSMAPAAKEKLEPFLREPKVYKPKGCSKCGGSGYTGRIGVFEVLRMTDELSDIILENPSELRIEKEAQRQGMITMRQDGIRKSLEGLTTIEEVLRVTSEL
ncbi:MAG: ATPase, T2SS/T4P/T4SS family [Patescibacteria group bacterium]